MSSLRFLLGRQAWKPGLLHGAAAAVHSLFTGRGDAPGESPPEDAQAPVEDHPSQTATDDVRPAAKTYSRGKTFIVVVCGESATSQQYYSPRHMKLHAGLLCNAVRRPAECRHHAPCACHAKHHHTDKC